MELRDPPDLSIARVTAVDRARYLIRDEYGELPAELTGRLQFVAESSIDLPCVGDWVCVRCLDGRSHASIHGVLPRKSFLRRKAPGKDIDFQMIAANIDVAFVIQACHFDFNVRRLERYLVMVREGRIEPVLLLTKTDLVSARELELLIDEIRLAGIDARLITVSNVTGAGLDRVRELLIPGKTYCLLGSSGVGKTTLINRLSGDSGRETGRRQPHGGGTSHDHASSTDRARERGSVDRHARHARAGHAGGQRRPRRCFRRCRAACSELPVHRLRSHERTRLRRAGGNRAA